MFFVLLGLFAVVSALYAFMSNRRKQLLQSTSAGAKDARTTSDDKVTTRAKTLASVLAAARTIGSHQQPASKPPQCLSTAGSSKHKASLLDELTRVAVTDPAEFDRRTARLGQGT